MQVVALHHATLPMVKACKRGPANICLKIGVLDSLGSTVGGSLELYAPCYKQLDSSNDVMIRNAKI